MENYTILQPFRYLSCYVTVRYLQLLFTPSWYQILVEICTVLQRPRYFWAFQKNLGLVPWKYHFSHCCNVSTAMLFELSDSGLQLQLKIFLDRWSVLGHSTAGLVRPGTYRTVCDYFYVKQLTSIEPCEGKHNVRGFNQPSLEMSLELYNTKV